MAIVDTDSFPNIKMSIWVGEVDKASKDHGPTDCVNGCEEEEKEQ